MTKFTFDVPTSDNDRCKSAVRNRLNARDLLAFYFSIALTIFAISFLAIESSGRRSTFFYVACALPALGIFLLRLREVLQETAIQLLLAFLVTYCCVLVITDGFSVAPMKQSSYIMLLYVAIYMATRNGYAFNAGALIFSFTTIAVGAFAVTPWLYNSLVLDEMARLAPGGALTNPVHTSLILLTGWLGLWFVYLLPLCRARGSMWLIAGYAVMLSYSALIITAFQARSTLVGLVLALVIYVSQHRERVIALAMIGGLSVILVALGLGEALLERGLSYRPEIWREALSIFVEHCHWVTGCGEPKALYLERFHHVHSAYLAILINTGVIGAIAFSAFALIVARDGVLSRSPWFALAAFGWGSLLTTSYGVITRPTSLWIYFWIPTLALIAINTRGRQSSPNKDESSPIHPQAMPK